MFAQDEDRMKATASKNSGERLTSSNVCNVRMCVCAAMIEHQSV